MRNIQYDEIALVHVYSARIIIILFFIQNQFTIKPPYTTIKASSETVRNSRRPKFRYNSPPMTTRFCVCLCYFSTSPVCSHRPGRFSQNTPLFMRHARHLARVCPWNNAHENFSQATFFAIRLSPVHDECINMLLYYIFYYQYGKCITLFRYG